MEEQPPVISELLPQDYQDCFVQNPFAITPEMAAQIEPKSFTIFGCAVRHGLGSCPTSVNVYHHLQDEIDERGRFRGCALIESSKPKDLPQRLASNYYNAAKRA